MMKRLRELCTATHVYIDGSLDIYMQDLISAARHFHELDGTRLTEIGATGTGLPAPR
ncbi:hypothetical protein EWM64_g10051 [Hericium alpestre]|uniref:Uncharacterized protein n=1 Tax=Hericium alpestre TaxID=135208 RepID=A0A4Y9ZID2_9AGAM|nr:hypothetical protein EWM64_g10051 [Hericium alpestre]